MLSQYNIAFYHIINHAFFVRQHRYWNLDFKIFSVLESHLIKWYDGPSFRNLLKKGISTYLPFEFKLNLRWERSMKMNFRQNCIVMIIYFYSFENFIMEKINEGSQVMSRCRIEKISSPYFRNNLFLMKIVSILKVGKLVNFFTKCKNFLLFLPLLLRIVNLTIQSGCRISTKHRNIKKLNHNNLNRNLLVRYHSTLLTKNLFSFNTLNSNIHTSYNRNIRFISNNSGFNNFDPFYKES